MRKAAAILCATVCSLAGTCGEPATVRAYGSDAPLWEFRPGGALAALRETPAGTEVLLLSSPSPDFGAPTVIGTLSATAREGVYEADFPAPERVAIRSRGAGNPRRAVVRFTAAGTRFTLEPYDTRRRITFTRWLPYLFRINLEKGHPRPNDIDGAVRISPSGGDGPVIL